MEILIKHACNTRHLMILYTDQEKQHKMALRWAGTLPSQGYYATVCVLPHSLDNRGLARYVGDLIARAQAQAAAEQASACEGWGSPPSGYNASPACPADAWGSRGSNASPAPELVAQAKAQAKAHACWVAAAERGSLPASGWGYPPSGFNAPPFFYQDRGPCLASLEEEGGDEAAASAEEQQEDEAKATESTNTTAAEELAPGSPTTTDRSLQFLTETEVEVESPFTAAEGGEWPVSVSHVLSTIFPHESSTVVRDVLNTARPCFYED